MLREGGYAILTDPDCGMVEASTFTCAHCNSIVHVKAKSKVDDIGGFCRMCMKPVCSKCVGFSCVPFEKRLDQLEASYHARRSYEI